MEESSGARGRDAGAPAGVTDFKAAIRYTRYNEGIIPGNMDEFYVEGMSGGGAQAAVIGASGDSSLYEEYLKEIGAVEGVSDAVTGAMCWCPITSLDSADMAYEWNMGNTRTDLSEEEQTISDLLTEAYAGYINETGFTDEDGNILTLEQSEDGRYQAGTYYDYVKTVVEESLNHFLSDTTFPYDADASSGNRGGGRISGERNGGGRGDFEGGMIPNNKDNMESPVESGRNLSDCQNGNGKRSYIVRDI